MAMEPNLEIPLTNMIPSVLARAGWWMLKRRKLDIEEVGEGDDDR